MKNTIHDTLGELIERQRIRLYRDDTGRSEWHTLPSLWEQLETSTAYSTGTGGNGGYGSQAPISTDVVALIIDVTRVARYGARNLGEPPLDNTPDNLRRIVAHAAGDDADWWHQQIRDWTTRARAALRLDPTRPRWARGVPCPDCGADSARSILDGESVRTPALVVLWADAKSDREYHSDQDWMVRAVECHACGATWWRGGGLDLLVQQVLNWNLTREVLAENA